MSTNKAIIADDEEPLRLSLVSLLKQTWPDLEICAQASNGIDALQQIEALHPDIAFLDIKMPGMSGMEVARQVADRCRIVFITAYERFAVEAFENAAVDYLLKPVDRARLELTISRLKKRLTEETLTPDPLEAVLQSLQDRLLVTQPVSYLRWIKVIDKQNLRLIPVEDICYFQAQDKYTVVVTEEDEFLIRKPIKLLSEELDPDMFWQIHRSTVVNATYIDRVSTSLTGRYSLTLKKIPGTFLISRSYRDRFKAM
jgi:DNA-binding LytR/AlgR family response regulator